MELKPGYYIVRREGEGEAGHLERLDRDWPTAADEWFGMGSEVWNAAPDGEIIAGPFTMAQISAAMQQLVLPSEPN